MEEYLKIAQIGKGTYGNVSLVRYHQKPKFFILKSLNIGNLSQEKLLDSLNEIHILQNLKSPFIIKFKEFFIQKDFLNIFMEYACNGDLNKMVCSKRKAKEFFSEEQVLKWMIQLFLAVFYLHEKDVVHCDLKLENIFLTYFNDVKIGDFGIAKILRNSTDSVKTCFGTPYYIAPELCEKQEFSKESDIWSLGCVFYYLLTLCPPFDGENLEELISNIRYNKYDETLLKRYSKNIQNLVCLMLQKRREDRIKIENVLKIDFIYVMHDFEKENLIKTIKGKNRKNNRKNKGK